MDAATAAPATSPAAGQGENAPARPWERHDDIGRLRRRVQVEYTELPGLRLTVRQAARLFGWPERVAEAVLDELHQSAVLTRSAHGSYALQPRSAPGPQVSGSECLCRPCPAHAPTGR